MIKIKNKHWYLSVTRGIPFWNMCLIVAGHFYHSRDFGVKVPMEQLTIVKKSQLSFVFNNKANAKRYSQAIEKVVLNQQKLKILKENYEKFGKEFLAAGEKLANHFTPQTYRQFAKQYQRYSAGLHLTTIIGRHIQQRLKEELEKLYPKKSPKTLERVIVGLSYPTIPSPFLESQLFLLKLGSYLQKRGLKATDIKNDISSRKMFAQYMKEFSPITVNFGGEPLTEKEVLAQLKEDLKKNCEKKKDNLRARHQELVQKAQQLIKEINNPLITKLAKALQAGTFFNEYRKYVFSKAGLACRPFFKEVAGKFGFKNWRECYYFTPQEIEELYFKNKRSMMNKKNQRKVVGVTYGRKGYQLISRTLVNKFLPETIQGLRRRKISQNEISGMTAFSGKIIGKVRVLLEKKDFTKFKKGEILVTAMTSVDFLPVMKKASAIITDEGGLTCHAATVSRELKIPCIIGTKIATQVLKNGDKVKIDAVKGIIKK